MIPWLAVVFFLALKPNRTRQAWWILMPLAGGVLLVMFLGSLDLIPSEPNNMLWLVFSSLVMGTALVWLVEPFGAAPSRGRTFLAAGALLFLSSLAFVAFRADWTAGLEESFMVAILIAIASVLMSGALLVSSLGCRRRFTAFRFLVGVIGSLLLLWTMVILPFFLFARLAGTAEWSEFIAALLLLAGACLVPLLPFLMLSFVHPFYRMRFGRVWCLSVPDLRSHP
jgi:hypothetical protein